MTELSVALVLVRDQLLLAASALERGDVVTAMAQFTAANEALQVAIAGLRSDES